MVKIKYESPSGIYERGETRERHFKALGIAKEVFGCFVAIIPQISGKEFLLRDFLNRKICDVNSKSLEVNLRLPKYEEKTVILVGRFKEEGLGEYTINAKYPNPHEF